MVLIIGSIVVMASVLIGFSMAGGHAHSLWHLSEVITIGGAALGALIIMSPVKVLMDLIKGLLQMLKGSPYSKATYNQLLQIVYDLAVVVRRDGIIALESHCSDPKSSTVFQNRPKVANNKHVMHFLTHAIGMIVDGMDTPALTEALQQEIAVVDREHHAAIAALSKTADALPGFGIVAAVLGIVVTMGHIDGPVEEIGHKVGAALVGTFLGILLSYGFFAPMAGRMEIAGEEEKIFLNTITSAAICIQQGVSPKELVNRLVRGMATNTRPSGEELKSICATR
jgi:chemotaxis protein MotA